MSRKERLVWPNFTRRRAAESNQTGATSGRSSGPKFFSDDPPLRATSPVLQRRELVYAACSLRTPHRCHGRSLGLQFIDTMAGLSARMASFPASLTAAFRNLSLASKRSFSTTLPTQKTKKLPEYIPPYPYGPNYLFKQSNSGLYGGAMIQFGNKISKGRNKGRTRRIWKPNVRRKKLWSDALGEYLYIKVTRRVLRTIWKSGGLDNYLLDDRPSRIKELGIFGWELRWKIMQTPKMQEKFREQRKKLGLPEPPSFEEWLKQKEQELKASVEEDLNVKEKTKPAHPFKLKLPGAGTPLDSRGKE